MVTKFRGVDLDPGWVKREIKQLRRELRELRSARRLPGSSIAGGVLTLHEILTDPAAGIAFENRDYAIAEADDVTVLLGLSHTPKSHSLQVKKNGTDLLPSEWILDGRLVTINPTVDLAIRHGNVFSAWYPYDGANETAAGGPSPLNFTTEINADGPILWATLGETSGSIAQDATTNNRDGTYGGTLVKGRAPVAPGLPGTSVDFGGVGWVEYAAAAWQRPPSFTAEIWALPASGTDAFIFCVDDAGTLDSDRIWNLTQETAGRIITGATPIPDEDPLIPPLTLGVPHHLALTFDGVTVNLYLDGVVVASGVSPGAMNTSTLWPLMIGSTADGQFGRIQIFDGLLQHAVMFDRALSADRISRHYRAGMGLA